MSRLSHEDYTVGWICALPVEMAAAQAMLDKLYDPLPSRPFDPNSYTLGRIGDHNVVVTCLPSGVMGTISAARVATNMTCTFRKLRFGLIVGIGGGVPSEDHDIRLGDVVVSRPTGSHGGVIQYDFGKTVQEGRFVLTGSLNRPPDVLLGAMAKLDAQHIQEDHKLVTYLEEMMKRYPKMRPLFTCPGIQHDTLYAMDYDHISGKRTCVQCKEDQLVDREPRISEVPAIHYGLIASGDQVMRHGATRDKLGREHNVLCFEMEAAGLMDTFPCVVIRGICDYADSHKNKRWQPYAAATAAAYAKELLNVILGNQATDTRAAKKENFTLGAARRTPGGHRDDVKPTASSRGAAWLASGSMDGTIKIWDIRDGKCFYTLKGHKGLVNSVAFSHDSAWLASGSGDGTVKIWDTISGKCLYTLEGHRYVYSVAFSHDSAWVASGSAEWTVNIWDMSSGKCLYTLEGYRSLVYSVAFSHDSAWLASGLDDETVKIWDTSRGKCLYTLKGHSDWVRSVAFSHNSAWLASGSADKTVKIWDMSNGKCLRTLTGHSHRVNSVTFSHNSAWLASGSGDGTVKIWDTSSGNCLYTLKGHEHRINSVVFSHDSAWLASGSDDKTVRIWDTSSGRCLQTLEGHSGNVLSVAIALPQ